MGRGGGGVGRRCTIYIYIYIYICYPHPQRSTVFVCCSAGGRRHEDSFGFVLLVWASREHCNKKTRQQGSFFSSVRTGENAKGLKHLMLTVLKLTHGRKGD